MPESLNGLLIILSFGSTCLALNLNALYTTKPGLKNMSDMPVQTGYTKYSQTSNYTIYNNPANARGMLTWLPNHKEICNNLYAFLKTDHSEIPDWVSPNNFDTYNYSGISTCPAYAEAARGAAKIIAKEFKGTDWSLFAFRPANRLDEPLSKFPASRDSPTKNDLDMKNATYFPAPGNLSSAATTPTIIIVPGFRTGWKSHVVLYMAGMFHFMRFNVLLMHEVPESEWYEVDGKLSEADVLGAVNVITEGKWGVDKKPFDMIGIHALSGGTMESQLAFFAEPKLKAMMLDSPIYKQFIQVSHAAANQISKTLPLPPSAQQVVSASAQGLTDIITNEVYECMRKYKGATILPNPWIPGVLMDIASPSVYIAGSKAEGREPFLVNLVGDDVIQYEDTLTAAADMSAYGYKPITWIPPFVTGGVANEFLTQNWVKYAEQWKAVKEMWMAAEDQKCMHHSRTHLLFPKSYIKLTCDYFLQKFNLNGYRDYVDGCEATYKKLWGDMYSEYKVTTAAPNVLIHRRRTQKNTNDRWTTTNTTSYFQIMDENSALFEVTKKDFNQTMRSFKAKWSKF